MGQRGAKRMPENFSYSKSTSCETCDWAYTEILQFPRGIQSSVGANEMFEHVGSNQRYWV